MQNNFGGVVQIDTNNQNKKAGLFGPQTDLSGMPIDAQAAAQQNPQNEKKEKTKRELMWEQRLAEK